MSNILQFTPKNKILENSNNEKEELPQMSIQDIEFLEDMISNSSLASNNEVEFECEDGFCITFTGEVKVSPKLKDYYNYLKNRNEQRRTMAIKERRLKNMKLV